MIPAHPKVTKTKKQKICAYGKLGWRDVVSMQGHATHDEKQKADPPERFDRQSKGQ